MQMPLSWAAWRVTARVRSDMTLSHHPGSRLAGALGSVLRTAHCSHGATEEGEDLCPAKQAACGAWPPCRYGELIRTQTLLPSGGRRDVPRPLIVALLDGGRQHYAGGEVLSFDITLIGRAVAHFPAIWRALEIVGDAGVGDDCRSGSGRFTIESVRPMYGPRPAPLVVDSEENRAYPMSWSEVIERTRGLRARVVRLEVVSPLRLLGGQRGEKSAHALRPEEFEFFPFWLSLSRRLKDLAHFHSEGALELPFLETDAVRVVRRDLQWWRVRRYSASQEREIDASGLLGCVDIEGEFESLLPFLVTGEWLHVGKNTDLGDGRYELRPL